MNKSTTFKTAQANASRFEALAGLPPSNNMGGKSPFVAVNPDDQSENWLFFETSKSNYKRFKVPRPDSNVSPSVALVDQVSFTAQVSDLPYSWFTEQDFVIRLSEDLEKIFGFGVTANRGKGINFYENAFVLGDRWGFVCIGGQNGTFLVQLTGQGAMAAADGWEHRLYDFLHTMPSARITRVDLAHDDYLGHYTPMKARDDYIAGKFTSGGRRPTCDQRGNWIFPDDKGLTFYVGKRENGKLLRVYEKGKQLGGPANDLYPKWCRQELELHNEGRIIPFEVLIRPGQFLAGSYPALAFITEEVERIKTKQKTAKITFERALKMVGRQVGKYLYVFQEVLGSSDEVLKRVIREGIPERLVMPDHAQSPPSLRFDLVTLDQALDRSFGPSFA